MLNETDLVRLGRDAAVSVAGADAVEEVEVSAGFDFNDRAAYHFSFLIDQSRARQGLGMVFVRLIQRLQDDLEDRGDSHVPVIRLLDRKDWDERSAA